MGLDSLPRGLSQRVMKEVGWCGVLPRVYLTKCSVSGFAVLVLDVGMARANSSTTDVLSSAQKSLRMGGDAACGADAENGD
jgi:hypothetical protein